MKRNLTAAMTLIALFAALVIPIQLAAQEQQKEKKHQPRYTVTDLGTAGGTFSAAGGMNDRGWVAGSATLAGDQNQHAFLWRHGHVTDLGTLGGPNSSAVADGTPNINDRGKIVGFAETSTPDPLGEEFFCGFGTGLVCLPFVWQHGVMMPLPTLGGNNGFANGINNRGQVTGLAENTTHDPTCVPPQVLQFKPVLWEKGEAHELPTLPGDTTGEAQGINDHGQAVGASINDCTASVIHAVLWQNDTVTDLGGLGGTFSFADHINDQGLVVGGSNLPGDTTSHAFLWTKDTGMQDLGTLPGDFSSGANSINSRGQAVGLSCDMNDNCRAFLWQNGVMRDLNTLVGAGSPLFLFLAYDINSRGQIAGWGLTSTGDVHAFLATPCHQDGAETEGCENVTEGNIAVRSETSESPKAALPENVRKLLRRRLGPFPHILVPTGATTGIAREAGSTQTLSIPASDGKLSDYLPGEEILPNILVRGLCIVDPSTKKLTGGCVGSMGLHCVGKRDPINCPAGQPAKRPEWLQLCVYARGYVDGARSCSAL